MPIAFEFDNSYLRAVVGQNPNRQFRVTGTIKLPFDQDEETLGQKLKNELRQQGITKIDAIAVLSRWQAEVREVSVPPAPDNELPDMVRFQARNEFMSLTDDWGLDYIRLDRSKEGPNHVLAAAVSPESIKRLQTICQSAGFALKHIVLQPLALLDLITANASDCNRAGLIIYPSTDRADLLVAIDDRLAVTRSIRFATDATSEKRSSMLISEARRTLASAKSKHDREITNAFVIGHEKRHKALEGNLTKSLGFDVQFINAFDAMPLASKLKRPEVEADYAALLGALVRENSTEKHAIDFLSPKRTVVRRPERARWLTYAGIALAASLLFLLFGWTHLKSQQRTIDSLQEKLTRISENNQGNGRRPAVDQIMGEVAVIDRWKLNDVNWLNELKQLSDRMLTPDDVIVDSLTASAGKRAPQVDMISRVASVEKETELLGTLDNRPYQLTPERSFEDESDSEYPLGLDLQTSFTPDLNTLVQKINQRATEFLQKQNETTTEQEQVDNQ